MSSQKNMFHGFIMQLTVVYIGLSLGGFIALLEGRLALTPLLIWITNMICGVFVIYTFQKNGANKFSNMIPIFITLFTVFGIIGAVFLWQQPIRFFSTSLILAVTTCSLVAIVGLIALLTGRAFKERNKE